MKGVTAMKNPAHRQETVSGNPCMTVTSLTSLILLTFTSAHRVG